LLRQSIFGNIQQEELPDAITSLWKHRYLQRLDLELGLGGVIYSERDLVERCWLVMHNN
jgi:hypothetical protein